MGNELDLYPRRDGEAPMPVKFLREEDVCMLSKFLTVHRDEITLPTEEPSFLPFWDEQESLNFGKLAYLLRYLKNSPVLAIIDYTPSSVINAVEQLQAFNFGGSWLDSLRSLIVDNVQNNIFQLEKLKSRKEELKTDFRVVCARLKFFK
ncbi:hypothetical protein QL285_054220 [Trifolium repens]|nr:hypothetical protein QL285_054220 [Trifolium repens]